MTLAKLVTTRVRAWIFWANLAFKGVLPSMLAGLGILVCLLVVNRMIEKRAVFSCVHGLVD